MNAAGNAHDTGKAQVERTARRAAEWLLDLPDANPSQREAFTAWLRESPAHVREFLAAAAWDRVFEHIDPGHAIDVDALWAEPAASVTQLQTSEPLRPPRGRRKRSIGYWAAAAGGVAVLAAMAWWQPSFEFFRTHHYSTALGEQRVIELDDGSIVHLNTDSRLAVRLTAQTRDLYLQSGQALFKVHHEAARPFRVHVDHTVIQAVGTQFDVYRRTDRLTTIAVLDGAVRIDRARRNGSETRSDPAGNPTETPVRLTAGQGLAINAGGRLGAPTRIDPAGATAWQQRRLIFRNTPLSQVAEEFNRYNRAPKIRVEGADLRNQPIWAVCDADDPASFARSFADDHSLEVDATEGEIVIREKSRPDGGGR